MAQPGNDFQNANRTINQVEMDCFWKVMDMQTYKSHHRLLIPVTATRAKTALKGRFKHVMNLVLSRIPSLLKPFRL